MKTTTFDNPITLHLADRTVEANYLCAISDTNLYQVQYWDGDCLRQPLAKRCTTCAAYYPINLRTGCPVCNPAAEQPPAPVLQTGIAS